MMRITPRARKIQAKRSTAPSGLTEATVRVPSIRPRQSRQGSTTLTSPFLRKAIAKGFGLSSVSPVIRYIGTQAPVVVLPGDVPVETSELTHIQSCLARITEAPLVASGRWNQATGEAIALFQQRAGLPVSGALDDGTRETLKRHCVEDGASVDDGGATSGEEGETEVLEPNLPYTVCDFIDPRIDVEAQYALYELTREGGAKYKASVEMLSCIKAGTLGGIYQEDQGAPAKKAVRAGLGWYGPIIKTYSAKTGNPGQQVVCFDDPPNEPPLLVFAKKIRRNRAIIKQGLLEAWSKCRVSRNVVRVTPKETICTRPLPPVPPPPDDRWNPLAVCKAPRCDPNAPTNDCGWDNYGQQYRCIPEEGRECGVCEWMKSCKYPRCSTRYPSALTCGNGGECVNVPGEACGVCKDASSNSKRCIDNSLEVLRKEWAECEEEYKRDALIKYLPTCGYKVYSCASALSYKKLISCLQALKCAVYPDHLEKYEDCRRKAHDRFLERNEFCRKLP